jgi:hypothetical protein
MEWNKLSDDRKRTILNQTAAIKGLPTQAIEKRLVGLAMPARDLSIWRSTAIQGIT